MERLRKAKLAGLVSISDLFGKSFREVVWRFLVCFSDSFQSIFDRVFDLMFGQGFDQVWGRGKPISTVYSTLRPKGKSSKNN